MTLNAWATSRPDRCPNGFAEVQHPHLCQCANDDYSRFVAALRNAVRPDGLIDQTLAREAMRGVIPPKSIASFYRLARNSALIEDTGERWDRSTDHAGRNGDKAPRKYRWLGQTSTDARSAAA